MNHEECPHCFMTLQQKSLEKHEKICKLNQPYVINKTQCSLCMKKYETISLLYIHFRRNHPEVGQNVGQSQCPVCQNYFTSVFQQHLSLCQRAFEFANLQEMKCKICQMKYSEQNNL